MKLSEVMFELGLYSLPYLARRVDAKVVWSRAFVNRSNLSLDLLNMSTSLEAERKERSIAVQKSNVESLTASFKHLATEERRLTELTSPVLEQGQGNEVTIKDLESD